MKVGIQLYSVKNTINNDPNPLGILKKVADLGYKYWEPAQVPYLPEMKFGLGALPAKEVKKLLNDYGVKLVGCHINPIYGDNYKEALDYFKELECPNIGWTGSFFANRDELDKWCAVYNEAGRLAKAYDMQFYYHSHWHEFQKFDGKYVMDIILDSTDPELVAFELDNYWAARGGMDPVKLIDQYKDRLIMLHQKDFSKDAGEPLNMFEFIDPNSVLTGKLHSEVRKVHHFAEVGNGVLPIQDYIDAGNKAGIPYILLEQDLCAIDELESIRISMEAFHKFSGIEWE
ncbi:sugar phosphate isomerase/epimerase family protein [Gehongia tenuis]|jgi:sugar phosphate isomerase/epimerase|uniref:Sugar phosphate isomerase/epimerase n=1 Tax=Gehongia tenuis TaxID=2763655 RepID=A0A926HPH4_9FIRM|nr:sugar phosphate isomerase/epimerase [Gehongia tenuis]MBC8531649.1 sugar phosphate isomerase/epimerase [Gehongia tenuis]